MPGMSKVLAARVRTVLLETDPAGVGEDGDAYREESVRITARLNTTLVFSELSEVVREELTEIFGDILDGLDDCIARIWSMLLMHEASPAGRAELSGGGEVRDEIGAA